MGTKAKTLALAVFVAPLFAYPAAADDHSQFLTWRHNQEERAARERGYDSDECGFECAMFGVIARQMIDERSRRLRQRQRPADPLY